MSQVKYEHPYRAGDWTQDIYPMPAFPTLMVTDVGRSSRWYQDVLGFADVFTARASDGTEVLAHLRWCRFGDLLLAPQRTPLEGSPGQGIVLNFAAEEVDALAERVRVVGAAIAEGPVDRPWNTRDLAVHDPDGYRLNFTAPQQALLQRIVAGEVPTMEEIAARIRGHRD